VIDILFTPFLFQISLFNSLNKILPHKIYPYNHDRGYEADQEDEEERKWQPEDEGENGFGDDPEIYKVHQDKEGNHPDEDQFEFQ